MDKQLDQFMRTLRLYTHIPAEESKQLARMVKSETIKKNDYFIRVEDRPEKFAFINQGIFRVYCVSDIGNEKTLAFRSEGQFIAPYTPVVSKQPVWYFIQALTDCHIYYIRVEDYHQLSKNHGCWELLEKNYIIDLFLEKEERERSLLMDSASDRYESFKDTYPRLEQRVQQNYIASYLGITPVSLSRLKSQKKT